MVVKQNDWIEVEYTGKLKDGNVFDTSKGRETLKYKVGAGMVIPGFDAAVIGMDVNSDKNFTIPFAEAYGPKNTDVVEIPKTSFKEATNLEKGKSYNFMTDMGPIKIDVEDVFEDKIKAAVNHPLAGEDLTFEIKLVKIFSEDEAKEYEDKLIAQHKAHEGHHHHEGHDHEGHDHSHEKGSCEDCDCDDDCDCSSQDSKESKDSCGCGHDH